MAGRKAATEHGAKARARAGEGDTDEQTGERQEYVPTQAEKDAEAASQRERDVMAGGPGEDEQEQSQEWQTFKYGDKEFRSQEELTNYIDQLQEERRAAPPPVPARREDTRTAEQKKRAGETIDWEKELYTDPKKVFAQYRDEIKEEIRGEMTAQYSADQTMRRFWTDFYAKNKDMEGKEFFVEAVFNRELPRIGEMPIKQSLDELGKAVRLEALKIGGDRQQGNGRSAERQRTLVEAGSGPAPRGGGDSRREGEREIPRTLSGVIRQRQAARSAPRTQSS